VNDSQPLTKDGVQCCTQVLALKMRGCPLNERYGDNSTGTAARLPARASKIESSMKLLWCWRCKAEMPMLDDDEYSQVMSFLPSAVGNLQTRFKSMLAEYERITGFRETNPNAVFHHRLSDYGPPCQHCGKPLRTPQARVCGSCMKPVSC
jgi:hypothetical protein